MPQKNIYYMQENNDTNPRWIIIIKAKKTRRQWNDTFSSAERREKRWG